MGKSQIRQTVYTEEGTTFGSLTTQGRSVLLEKRAKLEIEFKAQKTTLTRHLNNRPKHTDEAYDKALKNHIAAVRKVSKRLLIIYELTRSYAKAKDVRGMLLICDIAEGDGQKVFDDDAAFNQKERSSLSTQIRERTGNYNWYRLFALRLKRFFEALAPVTKAINGYHGFEDFVNGIDKLNPILSYVAWLYYVPRLFTNLLLLFKHTIPTPWMSDEERALKCWTRLQAEWSKRWFEILNDAVWLVVGVLNCFWLATPQGMMLTVGLYLFDVGMALVNYYKQVKKYDHLIADVMAQQKLINAKKEGLQQDVLQAINVAEHQGKIEEIINELSTLQCYLDSLNQWKAYEEKRLQQSIFVTVGLSIGMGISAVPIIVMMVGASLSGPWGLVIPLLAAIMVLTVCIAQYITSKQIEKQKPDTDIKDMGNLKVSLTVPRERKGSVSDLGMFRRTDRREGPSALRKGSISRRSSQSSNEEELEQEQTGTSSIR